MVVANGIMREYGHNVVDAELLLVLVVLVLSLGSLASSVPSSVPLPFPPPVKDMVESGEAAVVMEQERYRPRGVCSETKIKI